MSIAIVVTFIIMTTGFIAVSVKLLNNGEKQTNTSPHPSSITTLPPERDTCVPNVSEICNNGECVNDSRGVFTCECDPGFKGEKCEIQFDPCAQTECGNGTCVGGSCNDGGLCDGPSCDCDPGYIGKECEGHMCDLRPCQNDAPCRRISTGEGYRCQCGPHFGGYNCSINLRKIGECANDHDYSENIPDKRYVIQSRQHPWKLSFDRTWDEYESGFCSGTEIWAGLKHIESKASISAGWKLRLEVTYLPDVNTRPEWQAYHTFSLGDVSEFYKLHVDLISAGPMADVLRCDVRPALGNHTAISANEMKFSTPDKPDSNGCAVRYSGGWWFQDCFGIGFNMHQDSDAPAYKTGYFNCKRQIWRSFIKSTKMIIYKGKYKVRV